LQSDIGSLDLELLDDDAVLSIYQQTLSDHRFLIIINEANEIADVASLLLRTAPSGFILTARLSPQHLSVGLTLDLSGLSPEEARYLLEITEGAQAHEQEPALDQLIAIASGHPLALALISAQLREGVSADSLVHKLKESMEVMETRSVETRTRSVEEVIQFSYDHISEQSRRAVRLLSAFGGLRFTTDLAAEVLAVSFSDSKADLSALLMASFLTPHEPNVYQMHPLIQEFAVSFSWLPRTKRRFAELLRLQSEHWPDTISRHGLNLLETCGRVTTASATASTRGQLPNSFVSLKPEPRSA
jgi:hypothetical protein